MFYFIRFCGFEEGVFGAGWKWEVGAKGAEVLRIDPKFSLERYVKALPFDQSRIDRLVDGMRKAALK